MYNCTVFSSVFLRILFTVGNGPYFAFLLQRVPYLATLAKCISELTNALAIYYNYNGIYRKFQN
jgi:hypothetical protein